MIIIMKAGSTDQQIEAVSDKLKSMGMGALVSRGFVCSVFGVFGVVRLIVLEALEVVLGGENVVRVMKPYKIVSRVSHPEDSVVDIRGVKLGGKQVQIIAG